MTKTREVSEWSKELPWKGSVLAMVPRVRIPSSLLNLSFLFNVNFIRYCSSFFLLLNILKELVNQK